MGAGLYFSETVLFLSAYIRVYLHQLNKKSPCSSRESLVKFATYEEQSEQVFRAVLLNLNFSEHRGAQEGSD